ncbi:hypothetical protein LDL59_03995 [Kaistella anthropi]|nr:hypothetical protein [Kaistella anthropi]
MKSETAENTFILAKIYSKTGKKIKQKRMLKFLKISLKLKEKTINSQLNF